MGTRDTTAPDVEIGMAAALEAARRGLELGELPIGAATVRGGAIVSARHTEEVRQGRRLVHADLLALEDADRLQPTADERFATTLVVTLEPCLLCMGATMAFGAGRTHFALESPTDGAALAAEVWGKRVASLDGFALPHITSGIMRQDSLELLREYVAGRSSGGPWRWARDTVLSIDSAR